ncbi:MinD/ParA family protein [Thermostilla marina]
MYTAHDQAFRLRDLVRRRLAGSVVVPPLLVPICAGSRNVGATTVAVVIGERLAEEGNRVVLVTSENVTPEETEGAEKTAGWQGMLSGSVGFVDAVVPGSRGMLVLEPGTPSELFAAGTRVEKSDAVVARLAALLRQQVETDYVLIDVGAGCGAWCRAWLGIADTGLLVCSPDSTAIVAGYSWMKSVGAQSVARSVALVLNRAADAQAAADVRRRLEEACRRFLGVTIGWAGRLPEVESVDDSDAPWRRTHTSLSREAAAIVEHVMERRQRQRASLIAKSGASLEMRAASTTLRADAAQPTNEIERR